MTDVTAVRGHLSLSFYEPIRIMNGDEIWFFQVGLGGAITTPRISSKIIRPYPRKDRPGELRAYPKKDRPGEFPQIFYADNR